MITAVVAVALLAATPIRLEQVKRLSRGNVQALLSALDAKRAGEQVVTTRSALLPSVQLSLGAGYSITGPQRTSNTVVNTTGGFKSQQVEVPGYSSGSFSFSANLQQVLFDWSKWESLKEAGSAAAAARGIAEDQADASEQEGISRFYNLYSAQQSLSTLEQNVVLSQQQVDRAKALYEAGRGAKADIFAAQVNLGNDRISVVNQKSAIAAAQANLATWLSMPGDTELVAVKPAVLDQTAAPPPALDQALKTARSQRQLLVAQKEQVASAGQAVSAAKAAWLPTLGLNLTYRRGGPSFNPVFTDFTKQNQLSGSIGLSWDAFDGLARPATIRIAEANQTTAELNLQDTKRQIEGAVRTALLTLENSEEELKIATQNYQIAQQSSAAAQAQYQAGAATQLEVRDAQIKLIQSKLTLLQSRIDVEIDRANLQRAMGTLGTGATK